MNGQTVSYDADGNITSAPINSDMASFVFDERNRLTSALGSTYAYDLENNRTSKIENGQTTNYVVNPNATLSQVLMKTTGETTTYYVYGLGLLSEETQQDYKTYHYDLRGSTIALSNAAGTVTDTYSYTTPLTVVNYIVIMIIIAIPLLNIIMLFVWAFSKNTNLNKSNYAKANLIMIAIVICIYILLAIAGISLFNLTS